MSGFALATFQWLSGLMWQVAAILHSEVWSGLKALNLLKALYTLATQNVGHGSAPGAPPEA